MFTAESIKLLDKPARRRTDRAQRHFVDQDDGQNGVKVGDPTDPDDVIDPDDLIGTEPVQCQLLLPPSAQSETWWTALVLGRENDAVNPQDALVALAHVAYHLGVARANMGNVRTEPVTAGQLYETVEALYGTPGWAALVSLWQEAAGFRNPSASRNPTLLPSLPRSRPASRIKRYRRFRQTLHCWRRVCTRRSMRCPRGFKRLCCINQNHHPPGATWRAKAKEQSVKL
jgi:hypothetical protein